MLCKLKTAQNWKRGTGESNHVADCESKGQCRASMCPGLPASFNESRQLLAYPSA